MGLEGGQWRVVAVVAVLLLIISMGAECQKPLLTCLGGCENEITSCVMKCAMGAETADMGKLVSCLMDCVSDMTKCTTTCVKFAHPVPSTT